MIKHHYCWTVLTLTGGKNLKLAN